MNNIQPEELQALIQRIINSGVLGRSRTYSEILTYLAECAVSGNNPKEIAIAMDVLGRDTDFDVGKDSIVRVHIYHLRNKLKAYFEKYGKHEKYKLDIPKGQYILTAIPVADIPVETLSVTGQPLKRNAMTQWLAGLAILLLLINLFVQLNPESAELEEISVFAGLGPWQEMFDDAAPILILVGDYYIFGELNDRGEVLRMIREFDVNSPGELAFLQEMGVEGTDKYFDLNLNYIPSSTAYALTQVMQVLLQGVDPGRINLKMASEYSTADLANNHVIYLGYLSGLNNLYSLMFAGSGLEVGNTYDELNNLVTGEYYVSSSGLSSADAYKDYSMLATFPSPSGYQITMIAGMRDESLTNIAQQIANEVILRDIQISLDSNAEGNSFEALFEVTGFDNTNFNSELIYTNSRDSAAVDRVFGGN
ncbi:hypothetical protein N8303_05720 [Gammaproteobacteria bacterium]|jgi:hypothetical protein|nr:hypothetical protein [Gammaproteobacteria bacterium]